MISPTQQYNWRKAPSAYNKGFFDIEHQAIQRAVVDVSQLAQADLGILTLPKSVDRTGVQDATAAIEDTLGLANETPGASVWLGNGILLCGDVDMPGNNITVSGAGSGYSYGSTASVKTKLKAKPGTTTIFNLAVTGGVVDRSGCLLQDFEVDGNLTATNGVKVSNANLLHRIRATGCLDAGLLLANFTNGTHVSECGLIGSFGWGFKSQGSGTTVYSVDWRTNISLNQTGGADIEAGVGVKFAGVVESNGGPAIKIYRPNSMVGAFGNFDFYVWMEDNGATGDFTLVIDAQTRSEANAPWRIRFHKSRFAPSVATRKYASIMCAKWVDIDDCNFDGSTPSDTLTLGPEARFVAIREQGSTGGTPLTATQIDNAIAQGFRCYSSDREVKRTVGAGAPAATYANGWTGTAQYWFDREGVFWFGGSITTGTIGLSAFTLPVGYRPSVAKRFGVTSNGAFGELLVNTDGTVVPNVGSNVSFSLNGLSFPTG